MPPTPSIADPLDTVHRAACRFFMQEVNPRNGLIPDGTKPNSPASIAGVGFALAGYAVAVERGWMDRADAVARSLAALRFFHDAPQDGALDGTGYRGFYFHFLDMDTGRRAWKSELSTIDTALLLAGALAAAQYFDGPDAESELRDLADRLYRRADWQWAQHAKDGTEALAHGWKPERGFLHWRWNGYSEALLLYILALGSPTYPLPSASYDAFTADFRWKTIYGYAHVYAGPLFIHQFSHLWLDLRGIQDAYMRAKSAAFGIPIDYFENSRRATYVQRTYAIRNPRGFEGYGPDAWGFTATDGPGEVSRLVGGRTRRFYDYRARGAPFGPDDGTLAPWAAIASLPFAPEIVLDCIECLAKLRADTGDAYGFEKAYNPTFPAGESASGWVSPWHFALNEGPIVLAVENYRSGLLWQLMRTSPYVVAGLRQAGFTGGWLDAGSSAHEAVPASEREASIA